MNLLLRLGLLLFFALTAWSQTVTPPAHVRHGSIKRYEKFPSVNVDPRTVDVWLPEGYSARKRYAVLYMHDGQMLFDSTTTWNHQEWGVDEMVTKLTREGKIQDVIVVGIWNNQNKRHSEYFPQKPFEMLTQTMQDSLLMVNRRPNQRLLVTRVYSDAYLRFLVQELKPFIDRTFATKADRAHTFIAGSSMGGLISMYAISEYPSVFGGAACLSTHWPGAFITEDNPIPTVFFEYLKGHLPDPQTHKLYFDYGTATLDALYEPFQQKADVIIRTKGYTAKNWMTRKFEGEDHSEVAWRRRLHIPLTFLLKP